MCVTDEACARDAFHKRNRSDCGGRFDPAKARNEVECPIRRDGRRQAMPNCRGGVHRIPAAEAVDIRDKTESPLQDSSVKVMQDAQLCDIACLPYG